MNFFIKPKEQSETRFGFDLARKSLLKTNFSINQALSSYTYKHRDVRIFTCGGETLNDVGKLGRARIGTMHPRPLSVSQKR